MEATSLRILLVEDSKGDALLIDRTLRHAIPDLQVIQTADCLANTLRLLSEHEFDVALLDRSLPDVVDNSGLQSIQNIAPKLPVIFLTAYKNEVAAVEAIQDGAQDYITKDKIDGSAIKRAIQFAIIRKRFESTLVVRANLDHLTGLANRMAFENRLMVALAKMKRHGGGLGVLFLDLNRFKPINDTYGHALGDRLLTEIGRRLKACLRPYDMAARFGGDEFAILLEDAATVEHCAIVAQKLIASIEQPFCASGAEMAVGVSIGITTCPPGSACSCGELIRQADAAMYEAKASRESAYKLWTGQLETQKSVA